MTQISFETLNDLQLVQRYIVECRGRGHYLSYDDHFIVEEWLGCAKNCDSLLLILDEIIPNFFLEKQNKSVLPSLRQVHKKVMRKLHDAAMR